MSELTLVELEKVAATYEERLGPAVLQEWTQPVVDAAQIRPGQRVLDVACGTGLLARAAQVRVGAKGSVTGLDINPGMLAVAARIAPEIAWRQGEAESLPFEDHVFDAVISQFGLMFFTDKHQALREMTRVLRPGGRIAVAVFDKLENIAAYRAVAAVFERTVGKGAADALRLPFALGNANQLASLFAAAGIPSAAVATRRGSGRFASVRDMILADVRGWFPLARINVDERMTDAVVGEAQTALASFVMPDGTVDFPVSVHIVTATKA